METCNSFKMGTWLCVVGNNKRTSAFPRLVLATQALVAWPAMHSRAMTDLFLSHGDSDSELQNLSTQLARFPLAGRYHTSPMLQILHCLCCAHQTNPCFHAIPFSPIIDITSDKCVNTKSTISEVKAVPIEILCYRSKICTYMLLIFQTWQNETHTFAKFYFFR